MRRIAKELGTPKLVVPKFVFPKERFFEWQEGDDWLARFMGVGRQVLQPFEQEHDGYWTLPCIGFEGRDDEIRMVQTHGRGGFPEQRLNYAALGIQYQLARYPDEIYNTPVERKHLDLRRVVIAGCLIFAYVSPELTDRRAMLRLVALLEEEGVKVRFAEREIFPLDFFL